MRAGRLAEGLEALLRPRTTLVICTRRGGDYRASSGNCFVRIESVSRGKAVNRNHPIAIRFVGRLMQKCSRDRDIAPCNEVPSGLL